MLVTYLADLSDWQGSPCVERGLTFCTPLSLQLSCWLHLSNWHLRPCNLCGKGLHSCLPTTCSFVPLAFNKVLTQGTQKVLYTVLYKVLRPCNQCENGLHSCLPTTCSWKDTDEKSRTNATSVERGIFCFTNHMQLCTSCAPLGLPCFVCQIFLMRLQLFTCLRSQLYGCKA